jgi:transposase
MDRDRLKAYLEQGLSLIEIGALENRDPSTVGYWVQKHGLVANGRDKYAPRGSLTRAQLEPLVEAGSTLAEIAAELDRSQGTVRHWISKHGLESPKVVRRRERDRARANGSRTFLSTCRHHGETTFVIENSGRARCRQCRMERVVEWRRRRKATLVAEAGGRCVVCGYDECHAALEFHHLDPSTKKFSLSMRGVTRSLASSRAEAAKCVLLCANCHAAVESGAIELPPDAKLRD